MANKTVKKFTKAFKETQKNHPNYDKVVSILKDLKTSIEEFSKNKIILIPSRNTVCQDKITWTISIANKEGENNINIFDIDVEGTEVLLFNDYSNTVVECSNDEELVNAIENFIRNSDVVMLVNILKESEVQQ